MPDRIHFSNEPLTLAAALLLAIEQSAEAEAAAATQDVASGIYDLAIALACLALGEYRDAIDVGRDGLRMVGAGLGRHAVSGYGRACLALIRASERTGGGDHG